MTYFATKSTALAVAVAVAAHMSAVGLTLLRTELQDIIYSSMLTVHFLIPLSFRNLFAL